MKRITFEFSKDSQDKIIKSLEEYSPNEIGGILIGIKKGDNSFLVTDVSISNELNQSRFASFIRGTRKAQQLLKKHFRNKTGFYIGEWHSHPSFYLYPSTKDISTMNGIIRDSNYHAKFALLTIVKLDSAGEFMSKGFLFHETLENFISIE